MAEPSIRYRIATAIAALLGRDLPTVQAEPATSDTEDGEPKGLSNANFVSSMVRGWEELFRIGYDRRTRYADYDKMDDAEIAALLDAIVDATLVSDDGSFHGFQVEAGAKHKTVLADMVDRLDLQFHIREILRDCLKNGDEFIEIVIDEGMNIVRLQSVPCHQMYVGVDKHNRVLGGYDDARVVGGQVEQLPAAYRQQNRSGDVVAAWLPWEMCHLKWRENTKFPYAIRSFLEPSRKPWHKLRMLEESMVIARLVRAYLRLIHTLDETDRSTEDAEKDLAQYIERITKKKTAGGSLVTRPLMVDEDLFLTSGYIEGPDGQLHPKLGGIETVDPANRGLAQIDDVEYHRRKLFTRVSGEIVGIESDREDLSLQDIASSRLYQACQVHILERQLLWPLFRLQLLLKGYKPRRTDVNVIWPQVVIRSSWRFSDAMFRRAMGWRNHIEMATASRRWVAQEEHGYSDEEWERIKQEIQDEAILFPVIPQGSQAAQTGQGSRSA